MNKKILLWRFERHGNLEFGKGREGRRHLVHMEWIGTDEGLYARSDWFWETHVRGNTTESVRA